MTLVEFVLLCMLMLAPDRYHARLAMSITRAVETIGPIFTDDENLHKTAALAVSVAFRESTFRTGAIGDSGHAVCAFQIYDGPKSLLVDTDLCALYGLKMLQESAKVDHENPVAFYARGPRYQSDKARAISRDRVNLAKWAKAKVEHGRYSPAGRALVDK